MPDAISVKLEGLDVVRARLAVFPDRLRRNVMRGAIRAAATAFREGIRKRAPVKSGRLRRDIKLSARVFHDGRVSATVSVGTGKGDRRAFYAAALEAGAKPHQIKPAARRALMFGGRFAAIVRNHPGIRARRFVADAASGEYPRAVSVFEAYVRTRVGPLIGG